MAKEFEQSEHSFTSFIIVLVVSLLYFLACILPCVDCGPSGSEWDFEAGWWFGLAILLFGWSGGNNGVPWSANVFLALGLACLWSNWLRLAAWSGLIASVLGLTTWWVRRYNTLMVGYYVWQASLLLLAIGAMLAVCKSKREAVRMPIVGTQEQDLSHRLADYKANRSDELPEEEVNARLRGRQ